MDSAGTLVLAATPIGALTDASPRLTAELRTADVIAAEDTRRLRRLGAALGVQVSASVVSYFDGNEQQRTAALVAALRQGQRVLLLTDAGMPGISDPGYRLVSAAIDAGATVTVAPGPSAVLAALVVSGLPVDRFCFEGFLPRKTGDRSLRLAELADEPRTMVFFEAPHRASATLAAMVSAFGADRPAACCRELTKVHEEVRRGSLAELAGWAEGGVCGELTLVVGGAPSAPAETDPSMLAAAVASRRAAGMSRKDAVAAVAAETGSRRREVFEAAHRA